MQELINFSTYSLDTDRFNNDWAAITAYVRNLNGIAGLELLIGYEPLPAIPAGLVRAVHLPFWITWLEVWRSGEAGVARYFPDVSPEWLPYYCGGPTPADMVAVLRQLLLNAASLNPAYAVFHVSHVEPADVFTRRFAYSDAEVIDATADLLNTVAATFPAGEPPVRLFLENLWWPGLTFTSAQPAQRLAERLAFDNWAFVLDTGHLMNTNPALTSEAEAIAYVVGAIKQLPLAIRARIEGLHFNCSLSGPYQQVQIKAGLPPNFAQLPPEEQRSRAINVALQTDQHRPFTQSRCRNIIDAVQPRFLTHEFLSDTQAEYNHKLAVQLAALGHSLSPGG
jgi:hypothetical protein